MVFDDLRDTAASPFAVELGQFVTGNFAFAGLGEPAGEVVELTVVAGDFAERGARAGGIGKELFDAGLGLGGDLVGPLVALAAVLDEDLANLFSLLVLDVFEVELGGEAAAGPFDQLFALEALLLAGSAVRSIAIEAGQHRVLRLALDVGPDRALVGERDELRRARASRLPRAKSRRRTCRGASRRPP